MGLDIGLESLRNWIMRRRWQSLRLRHPSSQARVKRQLAAKQDQTLTFRQVDVICRL
jgi:hypothetical protein